jgi:hypothetical protein
MPLLPRLGEVLAGWKGCFRDRRTFRRAQEHALALLVSLGRRTISRSICVLGRQWRNGAADYRTACSRAAAGTPRPCSRWCWNSCPPG